MKKFLALSSKILVILTREASSSSSTGTVILSIRKYQPTSKEASFFLHFVLEISWHRRGWVQHRIELLAENSRDIRHPEPLVVSRALSLFELVFQFLVLPRESLHDLLVLLEAPFQFGNLFKGPITPQITTKESLGYFSVFWA